MTDSTQTSPPRGPSVAPVGSQPRGGDSHWETVRAAIERGLSEYAAAYFIPAWGIFGTDYPQQRRLAGTWGELAAPHITACIRADLRRTGGEPDWKSIAIQVARYGGSYHGLSTAERDALEAEVAGENEREWGTARERTEDAATGLEGR